MTLHEALRELHAVLAVTQRQDWRRVAIFPTEAVETLVRYIESELEKPTPPTTDYYS